MSRFARRLLGISEREISFTQRGFHPGDGGTVRRLERAGGHFVRGYNTALELPVEEVAACLERQDADVRGFFAEGAAMACALLDRISLFKRDRFATLLATAGDRHTYLLHVGAGWVLGRLPLAPAKFLARFHPLLRWLLLDGYGFHEAFFHQERCYERGEAPARLSGYARRAFDQGLGRALWFIECAEPERIAARIARLRAARRGDLWSGVGLACAYAGGSADAAARLLSASGDFAPSFAQGVAFACKAHALAGHLPPHTEEVSQTVWGTTATAAASVSDASLRDLPPDGAQPAYETWRERIRRAFPDQGSAPQFAAGIACGMAEHPTSHIQTHTP